jgi:chromate transporter
LHCETSFERITFAAYLGAAMAATPNGVVGSAVALVEIFLPGVLLV